MCDAHPHHYGQAAAPRLAQHVGPSRLRRALATTVLAAGLALFTTPLLAIPAAADEDPSGTPAATSSEPGQAATSDPSAASTTPSVTDDGSAPATSTEPLPTDPSAPSATPSAPSTPSAPTGPSAPPSPDCTDIEPPAAEPTAPESETPDSDPPDSDPPDSDPTAPGTPASPADSTSADPPSTELPACSESGEPGSPTVTAAEPTEPAGPAGEVPVAIDEPAATTAVPSQPPWPAVPRLGSSSGSAASSSGPTTSTPGSYDGAQAPIFGVLAGLDAPITASAPAPDLRRSAAELSTEAAQIPTILRGPALLAAMFLTVVSVGLARTALIARRLRKPLADPAS